MSVNILGIEWWGSVHYKGIRRIKWQGSPCEREASTAKGPHSPPSTTERKNPRLRGRPVQGSPVPPSQGRGKACQISGRPSVLHYEMKYKLL